MVILKKLLWKEWVRTFLGSALILFVLVAVAQLISGLLRTSVTPQEVLINFILEVPQTLTKVLPLSCLLATLFSINKLKNRSELVAIFAGGFSRRNLVYTILQAAVLVGGLQFINISILDPYTKILHKQLIKDGEKKFKGSKSKGLLTSVINSGKIWYRSDDYYMAYLFFDKAKGRLNDISLYYFNEAHEGTQLIKADYADGDEFGNWEFKNAIIIKDMKGDQFPNQSRTENLTLALNEAPSDFDSIDSDLNTLGPIQLYDFIKRIRNSGLSVIEYEIFFYDKIISAVICPIFALIPISLVFRPNRRSSSFGKNILFVVLFVIGFFVAHSGSLALGTSDKIPASLAVIMVPILSLLYFAFIFQQNRKLN